MCGLAGVVSPGRAATSLSACVQRMCGALGHRGPDGMGTYVADGVALGHTRLAIIDFPPRSGLDPVEGVPSNRGGHGIPQKIVIEELTAAGLQMEKVVHDWPDDDYCVFFVKK